MRVQLVDPSAFTPPYDRSLAAALARAGADVELLTSRFLHGPVPEAEATPSTRRSTGAAPRAAWTRPRGVRKLAEHAADMLRFRRGALSRAPPPTSSTTSGSPSRPSTASSLPTRPRVMTAHYILPPGPGALRRQAARRVFGAMDAVIAHSEHSARRFATRWTALPAST